MDCTSGFRSSLPQALSHAHSSARLPMSCRHFTARPMECEVVHARLLGACSPQRARVINALICQLILPQPIQSFLHCNLDLHLSPPSGQSFSSFPNDAHNENDFMNCSWPQSWPCEFASSTELLCLLYHAIDLDRYNRPLSLIMML